MPSVEGEGRHVLARKGLVPPDRDALLRQTFLHLLVVVGLELDQRCQDVLVVIPVLIVEEGGIELRFVGNLGPVQVGVTGIGLRLPQLLELVDLGLRYLAGTDQVSVLGNLQESERKFCNDDLS